MSLNNERSIKKRIGILIFLILLVCGGMVWAGLKLNDLYERSGSLFRSYSRQIEKIGEDTGYKFDRIIFCLDSLNPGKLIDSPVDLLPAEKKSDAQDSIRNILKDILKYYEQQAGQEATA